MKRTLAQIKKEAKRVGCYIGKLTTERDSQGEYTIYEDGVRANFCHWVEGDGANEAKIAYAEWKISESAY